MNTDRVKHLQLVDKLFSGNGYYYMRWDAGNHTIYKCENGTVSPRFFKKEDAIDSWHPSPFPAPIEKELLNTIGQIRSVRKVSKAQLFALVL